MKTSMICALAFALALAPAARAVDPSPDGGYANGNTAEGDNALFSLTTGENNTAVGTDALYRNTSQGDNTAIGYQALYNNRGGIAVGNTAIGVTALYSNIKGRENTATGRIALYSNETGDFNTADGNAALARNTTGNRNTATGSGALFFNTVGYDNTADGELSLAGNTTGQSNTAQGQHALYNNSTGSHNIAVGVNAGINLTTGNHNIDIGNKGVADEAATIRIGTRGTHTNTFIAGISGVTVAGGVGVIIDSNGQLGTVTSSERFKDEIKPMEKASEAILALRPVTFRYKHELDPEGIPQFGLVAEQVEKVNPALVARDEEGKAYTVRYEAVNAMLLNEFLKEHRKVELQEARLRREEQQIAQQQKQIEALRQDLRQVSERLNEPGLQTVGNNY